LSEPSFLYITLLKNVNPSTPRPEGRGLLGVDPERCFFTPPSKAGLGAVGWVKWFEGCVVNDEFKFRIAFA
jgi:hypothetical protein